MSPFKLTSVSLESGLSEIQITFSDLGVDSLDLSDLGLFGLSSEGFGLGLGLIFLQLFQNQNPMTHLRYFPF